MRYRGGFAPVIDVAAMERAAQGIEEPKAPEAPKLEHDAYIINPRTLDILESQRKIIESSRALNIDEPFGDEYFIDTIRLHKLFESIQNNYNEIIRLAHVMLDIDLGTSNENKDDISKKISLLIEEGRRLAVMAEHRICNSKMPIFEYDIKQRWNRKTQKICSQIGIIL